MAVGPFTLIATVFAVYKVIAMTAKATHGQGIPVVHSFKDIATGIAGALFICSPMLIATADIWLSPDRYRIRMKPLPGVGLLVWLLICLANRDFSPAPRWLLEEEKIPQEWRVGAQSAKFIG